MIIQKKKAKGNHRTSNRVVVRWNNSGERESEIMQQIINEMSAADVCILFVGKRDKDTG